MIAWSLSFSSSWFFRAPNSHGERPVHCIMTMRGALCCGICRLDIISIPPIIFLSQYVNLVTGKNNSDHYATYNKETSIHRAIYQIESTSAAGHFHLNPVVIFTQNSPTMRQLTLLLGVLAVMASLVGAIRPITQEAPMKDPSVTTPHERLVPPTPQSEPIAIDSHSLY